MKLDEWKSFIAVIEANVLQFRTSMEFEEWKGKSMENKWWKEEFEKVREAKWLEFHARMKEEEESGGQSEGQSEGKGGSEKVVSRQAFGNDGEADN